MSSNDDEYQPLPKGFATMTIRYGQDPEQWPNSSVIPPIVTSTIFKQPAPDKQQFHWCETRLKILSLAASLQPFTYSRLGNPTRNVLEKVLAQLEGAKYGLCFASGLGAVTALITLFKVGDHIVFCDDLYGGVTRMMNHICNRWNIKGSFVDATNLELLEGAITENTKAIWLEPVTNPTMKVMDLRAAAAIARKHNLLFIVDNTFLTPYLQRPMELGADVVLHSMTKYLNGHSDVIMGCILTSKEDVYERLKFSQYSTGIIPSPFDCYLANRGLKTLTLRMKQHSASSLVIARYLEAHPKIESVIHPCLESHPQHKLFKTQASGHSGIVSCYIKGNSADTIRFLCSLKIFILAESLGGYESLAELPNTMTHASVPVAQKQALKITDNLVRLSVGLEDAEDLIADLGQALEKV